MARRSIVGFQTRARVEPAGGGGVLGRKSGVVRDETGFGGGGSRASARSSSSRPRLGSRAWPVVLSTGVVGAGFVATLVTISGLSAEARATGAGGLSVVGVVATVAIGGVDGFGVTGAGVNAAPATVETRVAAGAEVAVSVVAVVASISAGAAKLKRNITGGVSW